jgi:hypothetical protein
MRLIHRMNKPHKDVLTVPALVGAYAVAGLFIQRAMRGSTAPLGMEHLLLVGGTAAVSSYVTPMLTSPYICQYRPTTPVVNAAVSSGIAYTLLRIEGVDMDGALMFVPVQVVSTLLAYQVAHMMWKMKHKKKKSLLHEQD